MSLEQILEKYSIKLKNEKNRVRNAVDIIEDFYLKLTPVEFNKIMQEISEEEEFKNIFDNARGRKYK